MNDISIITLAPSDWQKYKAIRLEVLQNDPTAFATTYQEDAQLTDSKWQERLGSNKTSYMLFAEHAGNIIGMVGAIFYEGSCIKHKATIVSMYVSPAYRGQGIGKKLMIAMMEHLNMMPNIVHVQLAVNTENIPAIKLYESVGFKKIGILEKLVKINNTFIDSYIMTYIYKR